MPSTYFFTALRLVSEICVSGTHSASKVYCADFNYFFLCFPLLGEQEDKMNQENYNFGGPRLTTFMIYLSDVEAGGHTVFSSIGKRRAFKKMDLVHSIITYILADFVNVSCVSQNQYLA